MPHDDYHNAPHRANDAQGPRLPASSSDTQAALVFALVAQRLTTYYDHEHWLTLAQGATLCADWLARSRCHLPAQQRKHLSGLSDLFARQIAASVSRPAGLHIAFEMTESLDAHHHSELGCSLMDECRKLVDGDGA